MGPLEAGAPTGPLEAKAKPPAQAPQPLKQELGYQPPPAPLLREPAAGAPKRPEPAEPALRRARRFSELEADCAALGVGEGSRGAHGAPEPDLEPARRRARALLHGALVEAAAGLLEALAR